MILAIDFDRTIHDNDAIPEGRKMGPPKAGAVEALTKLKELGHTIIIHTCRANDGSAAIVVVDKWMKYFNIPYDYVWPYSDHNQVKPVADAYIDDKGIRFHNWNQVMSELNISWP